MSPVHVLVSEDPGDEQVWLGAFAGAVDLYRFPRNVEAFERLTAAAAKIDLLLITARQSGPFNLSADQLVARLLHGALARAENLSSMQIVVVGSALRSNDPRVSCVSSLDAAIRLIKFGEIEKAPEPVFSPESINLAERAIGVQSRASSIPVRAGTSADAETFASSVISQVWCRADRPVQLAPAAPVQLRPGVAPRQHVSGGGPTRPRGLPPQNTPLFTRPAITPPPESCPAAMSEPASRRPPQVRGGGPATALPTHPMQPPRPYRGAAAVASSPQPASTREAVEVGTGSGLVPARRYQLPHGAQYRGDPARAGRMHGASHATAASVAQPVPPQLAAQIQSLVYTGGAPAPDPMLSFSSSSRGTVVARGVPVPGHGPAPARDLSHPSAGPGTAAGVQTTQTTASLASDPFLRRAEEGRGVSFG